MRFSLTRTLLCLVLLSPAMAGAQEAAPAEPAPEAAAQPAPEAASDSTAAPPSAAAAATLGQPAAGKGQVVFFREKKFAGAAINYIVREGSQELGKLSSGSVFVLDVEPGQHAYTVHSEAKDVLNLEVEAGETYYVIGSISMGFLAGRPNLSPSDQATYASMSAKLKPAKPLKK